MKSSIEKNQESGEQIAPKKSNDVDTSIRHFIKYQLPLQSTQFKFRFLNLFHRPYRSYGSPI